MNYEMTDNCRAALILNALSHWGPIRVNRALDALQCSVVELLQADARTLRGVRDIGPKSIDSLIHWESLVDVATETRRLSEFGAQFIDRDSPIYPERLKSYPDAPIGLYWKGETRADAAVVAIIGSRRTSPYGRKVAEDWSRQLSESGITVVSGLARGIDACAHQGALKGRGKTIAVLGSGLDRLYPPEHLDLFRTITAEGAAITEFPFGTAASKTSFPMRNRIVSGMVRLVLVVETDVEGGSLITAKFAADQGKLVCAVPGRIDSPSSSGCHQLIRDGAILVTSVEEVLEELSWRESPPNLFTASQTSAAELPESEARLFKLFSGGTAWSPDALVDTVRLPFPEVASNLMMLEIRGLIVKRGDGRYEQA